MVEVSHGEYVRLKITSTGPELQVTQRDNERDDDMEEQANIDVIWRPPQCDKGPHGDSLHLKQEWHRVSCDARLLLNRLLQAVCFNPLDLLDGLLELRRIVPDVGPVTVTNMWGKTSTDGIEHVLRRIDIVGANSSMTSKVLSNGSRVFTDISKVYLQK